VGGGILCDIIEAEQIHHDNRTRELVLIRKEPFHLFFRRS
jgi:hypothetical protein